jgi:SurA-like N-terminal domain
MSRNKRAVIVIGAFVLVAMVGVVGGAYALHLGPWEEQAQSLDLGPVIARVDGQPIYLHEAEERVEGLRSIHGNIEDVLGKDWQDRVLQSLVDDRILREQAEKLGIVVTDQDVQAWIDEIQRQIGTDQTLEQWLTTQRMTMAELERRGELQLIGGRVYDAVTEDVTVSAAEVRDYYRANKVQYENGDGSTQSLLEVSASIRQSLRQSKQEEAYTAWLDDARSKANIVVVMDDWWRNL